MDAIAFNNLEEGEAFIRKPSIVSRASKTMMSDAMSFRSFGKRQSLKRPYVFESPVQASPQQRGGFHAVAEEATNMSSGHPDTTDPEVPKRNIFSSDTNDGFSSNFHSRIFSNHSRLRKETCPNVGTAVGKQSRI